MNSSGRKFFCLICLVVFPALAFPAPLPDDAFNDFVLDAPNNEVIVAKGRTFEDNGDRQLKQISLSSLVGDFEKNIFASALSLNKVFADTNISVPDVKVKDDFGHDGNNKQQSLTAQESNSQSSATVIIKTTTELSALPSTNKVILQTAEKIPQTNDEPTHIVIDRIAIQPHTGGLASIPTFELKQSGKDEDANKDQEITKITISKTEITSLSTATADSSSVPSTTESALESISTPKNIENLKQAEKDLKEKVAEIEAEPIILSARV